MKTPIEVSISAKTWTKVEKIHRQLSSFKELGWGGRECSIFYETKKQKRHIMSDTVEKVLGNWGEVFQLLNEQNRSENEQESE